MRKESETDTHLSAKKWAVVVLVERTWSVSLDVFFGENESEAKAASEEYYKNKKCKILSITKIPEKVDEIYWKGVNKTCSGRE